MWLVWLSWKVAAKRRSIGSGFQTSTEACITDTWLDLHSAWEKPTVGQVST